MPRTRVIPTTLGLADFYTFENLDKGDLFIDASNINREDPTSLVEAMESQILWMKTDDKGKAGGSLAVSMENGALKVFDDDALVIRIHQRNMWEGWT